MEPLINYHDIAMAELFEQYEICRNDKKQIVADFLSSFSTNNKKLRAILPVYAIMQTFPNHKFYSARENTLDRITPCSICADPYGYRSKGGRYEPDWDSYMNTGGLIGPGIDDFLYYLTEYNKSRNKEANVTTEDLHIFSEIITVIWNADESDTIRTITKKIKKVENFKANEEERKVLLETLGYCGILETSEHKGAFHKYTNLGVAPRKSHNSDWKYPVDFWKGTDGINKEAFKFWFGEYKELERLIT